MIDNRNLILAIVLSVGILLAFNFFSAQQSQQQVAQQGGQTTAQTQQPSAAPGAPPAAQAPASGEASAPVSAGSTKAAGTAAKAAAPTMKEVLAETPRVQIHGAHLDGSLSLVGARFDDVTLPDYRETIDPKSPAIVVLKPRGLPAAYFAEFGWVPKGDVKVPAGDTLWTADRDTIETGKPVTLTWDNGAGLTFVRKIAIDDHYMFTVTDSVENSGSAPVTLYPYGLISRSQTPETTRYYILFEGLLGVFNESLKEVKYDDLKKDGTIDETSTGGWIGITDKYWLSALVPDQKAQAKSTFRYHLENGVDKYQVDYLGGAVTVDPGASASNTSHLFAGAKVVNLLDDYQNKLGIDRFELAIDFGWFYFLTKPIFYILNFLHGYVGNFGIAILLLTVTIKLLFFPLANKSYRAMSKMKKLQPEMQKLREQFGDDKQRLNQEMMALYKREKANPASGCLPMVIQIPVFFSLYKVLFVTIEMRHAPFYGWIHDLSARDPTSLFNLFGLINWDPSQIIPAAINIGAWPLIMGVTMFLQQKLNPQPADPIQAKVFMFLPLVFTFLLAHFPAGLVIYWAWNNTLSIAQQWVIMKRAGVR